MLVLNRILFSVVSSIFKHTKNIQAIYVKNFNVFIHSFPSLVIVKQYKEPTRVFRMGRIPGKVNRMISTDEAARASEASLFKTAKRDEREENLRGMGRHSWKCSRFKRAQMKIIHKYNLVHNFDFICFPYK